MTRLHIDFETRSTEDLRAVGLHNYVRHPNTDVWMACWAVDDGPVYTWFPDDEDDNADQLLALLADSNVTVVGHNVGFELAVIEHICAPRYGWPVIPPERSDCTAARAAYMCLPRNLEGACLEAGVSHQKSKDGHRLMLQMCRPRRVGEDGSIVWWDLPAKVDALEAYCRQDVEAERDLDRVLRPLPETERKVWLLNHRINSEGVRVDRKTTHRLATVLSELRKYGDKQFRQIVRTVGPKENWVPTMPTQIARLGRWLKHHGIQFTGLDKAGIAELLSRSDEEVPPLIKEALTIRRDFGKSSVSKIQSILDRVGPDGYVRELLMYYGATTGRFAGMGIQLHNFPSREAMKPDEVEELFDLVCLHPTPEQLVADFPNILTMISGALRGLLIAGRGRRFVSADYANIEGRKLAWLAGNTLLLEAFAQGDDIYVDMAAYVFGVDPSEVTPAQRFLGKVIILGCGFGMGPAKFRATCEAFGIDLKMVLSAAERYEFVVDPLDPEAYPTQEAADEAMVVMASEKVIRAYREKNASHKALWYALEAAAIDAIRRPGETVNCGPGAFSYRMELDGKVPTLLVRLPSGRLLFYPHAKLEPTETPWGETKDQMVYRTNIATSGANMWGWTSTYGGKLTENIVQALARDILVEAMLRLEDGGYRVVFSVHDEIICEAPESGDPDVQLSEMRQLMTVVPVWAKGLPLATEGWFGQRFRK